MFAISKRSSMSLTDVQRQTAGSGPGSKDKQGDVNMNEMVNESGDISLSVVLPDGNVKALDVKHNTPMMDLLVQVASSYRLKPGEHVISVISEETGRTMDYQSSQTIGSLGVNRIFLLNKALQKKQRESEIQKQKDASKFEQTIRVTINLPRGVKSLQRLNPNVPIIDLFRKICIDKSLDASRYEVRLTKERRTNVDMSKTLNDYHCNEITIVQCSDEASSGQVPDYHTSMVDISRVGMSASTATSNGAARLSADPFDKVRKKKGLFSFLRKDKSKSALADDRHSKDDDVDIPNAWKKLDQNRSQSVQALPQNGDITMSRKPQAQVKPQPKVQPTIREETEDEDIIRNKVKKNPSKKKYRAPVPPSRPLSTMDPIKEEQKMVMYVSTPNLTTSSSAATNSKTRNTSADARHHSRNSSDSSGYHEPPVTPPDSASSPSTINASLSRQTKKPAQTGPTSTHQKPVSAIVQRSQTLPAGATAAPKKNVKKKPAPVPPQTTVNVERTPSPKTLTLDNRIVESEDEMGSLSSPDDDAPELGIATPSFKSVPPPIFIPPPPPESPPPPAVSESPHRETPGLKSGSPSHVNRELSKTPSEHDQAANHTRSESRCSRTSVNTIDDVQQYFDVAIAAGESQLKKEQGSPTSPPAAKTEVSKLTQSMAALTNNIRKEPVVAAVSEPSRSEPTQDEVDAAVAKIDLCVGEDEGSDASLVPDGENFVVAASKLPSGGKIEDLNGSIRSTNSESGYVKPVEEISYGEVMRFDNPFRNEVPPVQLSSDAAKEPLTRRDSQMSDSTLPDSEHTDRQQSGSLQSSGLQSDEEESVTETGDGYDTTGTDKVGQSENETAADIPLAAAQTVPKTNKRGLFIEAKGQDVDRVIYGGRDIGSIRGVPGQDSTDHEVKSRAASFTIPKFSEAKPVVVERKPEQVRPKSVFAILSSQKVTSASPKRKTSGSAVPSDPAPRPASGTVSGTVSGNASKVVPADESASSSLYSRPLPVYNRMNRQDSNKATDSISTVISSPTTSEPKPLASVIADSFRSGEAAKSRRKLPDSTNKPMFFRASRNSRTEMPSTPDKIENVVKLDVSKFEVEADTSVKPGKGSLPGPPSATQKKATPPPTAAKPNKPGASLNRKESLKEQYNKLQENMAKWQNRLKDNESRVKELTVSQQNLSAAGLQIDSGSASGGMVKSTSTSAALLKKPFTIDDDDKFQSVSSGLHKVTLKSATERVIQKAEPPLDPVEHLMKSIRDRAGRTSEDAPDRGIYVAAGEVDKSVPGTVAAREIAPSVISGLNGVPPPPPLQAATSTEKRDTPRRYNSDKKLLNGTNKANDPRFNPLPSTRDSLLAQIANAKGKPSSRRKVPLDSSSSHSSSDELREIEVRHKPQKAHKYRNKNSKRSVSDPFPPRGPNSRNSIQPTPTELDPREELMIAVRNSGGLNRLRQVNADEIKWSAQV